ncbi:MAG: bifunctional UDP-N-acetylmuramoyl-tripeptide:D-alanyl-D-alanine ligase/alanine racemase [Ginsengibacter sp.]
MTAPIHYTIQEIAKICKAKWISKNGLLSVLSYVSLDSRKISYPSETVFFAVKSKSGDANLFLENVFQKGVRNLVTDNEHLDPVKFPGANILLVRDTVSALQHLAAFHRRQFSKQNLTVIGLTGSNGKTIVKEWLNQLLEKDFSIIRSPKSFNSQIGVPLSVLHTSAANNLAIFEAGISQPGEMKNLEAIIKPQIGIFTNIGNAHNEGFKSIRQKIREKLLLFKNAEFVVFPSGDQRLLREMQFFQKKNKQLQLFSWGTNIDDILKIISVKKTNSFSEITAEYNKTKFRIKIPFTDNASIENAINCWCTLFILNKNIKSIRERFLSLYPIEMRLELKSGINRCTLINDSYSNDLSSLRIALDFLEHQKQNAGRTVILSDIVQSGIKPVELYKEVASLMQQKKVNKFVGIGSDIFFHQSSFSDIANRSFFKTTEDFLKNIFLSSFHDETILIKGARQFGFERISHLLEQKVHQTVLSINLTSIAYNLKQYKIKLKPDTKMMVMVKAFGYGSGSYEIASVLEFNKVDYLAVAYADEGIDLRNAGITLPIMVMNTDESTFDALINFNLEPEIFSFGLLSQFSDFLKKADIGPYPVHLKIDSGMHRLGFLENEIEVLADYLKHNHLVKIKTAFSHFAASDDPAEDAFTLEQFNTFTRCCHKLEKILNYRFDKHIDNTSGISRHPEFQLDMVRLGIGIHGFDSNSKMQKHLKNVSTLVTTISQIKEIKAGETVGYGHKAKVKRDSMIAVVRIGYADGYSRRFGNGVGKMMINNLPVPTIGNICMDMTMLDVTGIKEVAEGDEVLVFGESLSLKTLADWAGTIPYEIMTSISQRVKRIYFEE